ncbi:MAG: hypothetical protein HUU02_09605 [Bacteroidetes bacterium]|nr:hypothetical protein [Bacteroidota bacterium]
MRTSVIAAILICLIAGTLSAQPPEGMGNRRPMERLERFKKIRMVEALNLDEETGLKLVSRYTKHRERMKELEEERLAVVERLEALVQLCAERRGTVADPRLKAILDDIDLRAQVELAKLGRAS